MPGEIQVNFRANVSSVEQGADRIERSLRDAERSLDDLGNTGVDTGRKMERSLDDVDTATGRARGSVGDLASGVGGDLRNAFQQFDGTAESAVQSAGDAIQGLASIIPGIGGFVGGALGGIASGFAQMWQENADKAKQAVSDAFDDMVESGNTFASQEALGKAAKAVLQDTTLTALAKQQADALKLPYDTVIGAMAGVPQSVALVNQALAESNGVIQTAANAGKGLTNVQIEQFTANQKLTEQIKTQTGAYDSQASGAQTYLNIMANISGSSDEAAGAVGRVTDAVHALPEGKQIRVSVDDSQLTALERRIAQIGRAGIQLPAQVTQYGRNLQ